MNKLIISMLVFVMSSQAQIITKEERDVFAANGVGNGGDVIVCFEDPNVKVQVENILRRNKKENRYELTTKGILASIGIVPLKSNVIFQKYVAFVSRHLPTKGSNVFVKKCVTEFMKLILAWHYLNGINLTKQKYSNPYYMEFFDKIKDSSSIMINHLQKKDKISWF